MATIIILSDIHGNLDALQNTWRDIGGRPYEALFCLGDLAAFGPDPEECIAFLRDVVQPTATILGNTDRYLLEESWKNADESELQRSLRWTREQLSDASLEWLGQVPETYSQVLDGVDIELVHGGPGDDEFGIGSKSDPDALEKMFADHGPGVTFCGHTHVPWRGRVGERHIMNVGSVGFPFDGDHRSSYVRLHVSGGRVHDYDCRRVVFNSERVIQRLQDKAVPFRDTTIRRLRFAEIDFVPSVRPAS